MKSVLAAHTGKQYDDDVFRFTGKLITKHSGASRFMAKKDIARYWDTAYKFGVMRNPWERAVSLWTLAAQKRNYKGRGYRSGLEIGLRKKGFGTRTIQNITRTCLELGFKYWLMEFCPHYRWTQFKRIDYVDQTKDPSIMQLPQVVWFQNRDGELLVDEVFSLDHATDMFSALHRKIRTPLVAPHLYRETKTDYREYYDDQSRNYIAKIFAPDIKKFGFEFGGKSSAKSLTADTWLK